MDILKAFRAVSAAFLLLFLVSCGADSGSSGTTSTTGGAEDEGDVTVRIKAEFGLSNSVSARLVSALTERLQTCPSGVAQDEPHFEAGLDCDLDGGIIRFVTPQSFKVAIKRLTFLRDDGESVVIVADTGTLSAANVYDLTSGVSVLSRALPVGEYPFAEAELYYYEIEMPVNSASDVRTLRVYLSDDDFISEGNRGHHQGDIVFIGSDGGELGWVGDGLLWDEEHLQSERGTINGAGGADPQSGHLRGLFGDETLWNQTLFMQGAERDVYIMRVPLDLLIEGGSHKTATFTFNAEDSWFYEDFDGNEVFNPCIGSDACSEGAAWAPLFPSPDIVIE